MPWFSSQQIQRDMAVLRHILCSIALANTTIVFTKADIEPTFKGSQGSGRLFGLQAR